MSIQVSPPPAAEDDFAPIARSRWAARAVMVFSGLICLGSAMAFFWQLAHVGESGVPFRDTPGAWPRLAGHLIRSVLGGVLAHALWAYLRAARGLESGDRRQLGPLLEALSGFWSALAFSLIVFVLLNLLSALPLGMPAPPTHYPFYPRPGVEPEVKVALHLGEREPGEGLIERPDPDQRERLYLHPKPILTNEDIESAQVTLRVGGLGVAVQFTPEGAEKIFEATEANPGKVMAIVVDGKVVFAPRITNPIRDNAMLTGRYTDAQAEQLARNLTGQR